MNNPAAAPLHRLAALLLALILVISALLAVSMYTRGHNWGDDFAAYLMQAQSLLDGTVRESLTRNAFTIETSSPPPGPIVTAWGYPILLTPGLAIFGLDPLRLKVINLLAYTAFLIAFYGLLRLKFPAGLSLMVTAVFAFNPMLLQAADQLISEIAFLCFSTLALFLIERSLQPNAGPPTAAACLAIGLAIFAAYAIRLNGVFLFGALVMALWVQLRDAGRVLKSRALILPCLTFALVAALQWSLLPHAEGAYLAFFVWPTPATLLANAGPYLWMPARMFTGLPMGTVFGALLLGFFVIGLVARPLKHGALAVYAFVYLGGLVALPFATVLRFIYPILPPIALIAAEGWMTVTRMIARAPRSVWQWIAMAAAAALILLSLVESVAIGLTNLQNQRNIPGPFDPLSTEMFAFVRSHTPPDSVVIFFKPRAMALLTGRYAFRTTACEGLPQGDYLIQHVQPQAAQPADPMACTNVKLLPVFKNPAFTIYHIE